MDDWFPLWLSLRVAATATVLAGTTGVALAYLLAKGRFRGRALLEAIVTLPIVLPPTVLGYYLLTTLGVNSPIGRAWESLTGAPLVFTTTAADPRLEAVARVAGHAEWRVAALVTLPVARRGIGAGVGLGFARALGDFGATVMVAGNIPGRTQTLPIAVYDAVQAGDGSTARTGSFLLAVVAIVVLLAVTQLSTPSRAYGRP
jgi:molybdate transport system permease protein